MRTDRRGLVFLVLTAAFLFAAIGAIAQAPEPDPATACAAARQFLDRQLVENNPREIETCDTAIVAGNDGRWVAVFDVKTVGRTVPPIPISLTFKVVMTHAPDTDPPWRLENISGE